MGIYPVWDSLDFSNLSNFFLPHFRKFFNSYLLTYFLMVFLFVFFWDSYDSNFGALIIVPYVSEVVLISFNSVFFFPLCFIYFCYSIFYLTYPIFCLPYSTFGSLQSVFDLIICIIHYILALFLFLLKVKVKLLSHVRFFATPWTVAYQAPLSMGFSGNSTGVDCHFLLQRIFPKPLEF